MSVLPLPSNLPVGYRFHPTDQELIGHFLKLKINGKHSQVDHIIAEVDFYKWEPWELRSISKVQSNDDMWWFFCRRDYKYPNSTRAKRTTEAGFWKITGKERTIKARNGKACIGKKKTLVFYKGPSPGKRTNWVMQEYYVELEPDKALTQQSAYVICRLKKKSDDKADSPNGDQGEPSGDFNTDFDDQRTSLVIEGVHVHSEVNLESIFSPDWYLTSQGMNSGLANGFIGDVNFTQTLFAADESEECPEMFADSLIVDPTENIYGRTSHNVSSTTHLQTSLKRAYFGDGPVSSDTDTEGVGQRFQILDTPSMIGSPGGSKKVRHMRKMKTPSETLITSTGQHSRLQTVIPVRNQFSEDDASSDELTEYVGEINCLNVVEEEEERPRYAVVSRGGHHRRVQAQKKVSPTAIQGNMAREAAKHNITVVDKSQKEKSTKDQSENGRKMVQSSNVEKHLKLESCESSASKWKSFFTFEETFSISSCNSRPPSEYLFNAAVGTILFLAFVRELVLYGSWC